LRAVGVIERIAVHINHDVHWVENLLGDYFKGFKNVPLKLGCCGHLQGGLKRAGAIEKGV